MSQKQHHNDDDNQIKNGMVRGLQNRHVQLIAIAGTIGTGLFLGAGRSISYRTFNHPSLYADRCPHVPHDASYR